MVLTTQILKTGHVPLPKDAWTYSVYARMLGFHILNAFVITGVGMEYKWASVLIGLIMLLSEILVMYWLVKSVFRNQKLALMSAMFICISDNALDMTGKSIIPNSVGVVAVLFVFYLLIKTLLLEGYLKPKIILLLLIFSSSLVITHSVSYGFLLIRLMIFVLLSILLRDSSRLKQMGGFLFVVALVLAFFEWGGLINGYYLSQFILLMKFLFLGTGVHVYEQNVSSIPLNLVIIARIGTILYFAIAGITILWELRSVFKDKSKAKLGMFINSAFFVGIAPVLTFFWAGIAHRFWYYGEILGSFFVSYFALKLSNWSKLAKLFSALFVVIISFLMFVASVSNDDNPLVPQYTLRTGWYDSEITAAKFVITKSQLPIATDIDFQHFSSVRVGMLDKSFKASPICNLKTFDSIIENNNCLVLLRVDLLKERYFVLGKGYSQRAYLPLGAKTKEVIGKILASKDIVYTTKNVIAVV